MEEHIIPKTATKARGTRARVERIEAEIGADLFAKVQECAKVEGVTIEQFVEGALKQGLKRMLGK